MICNRLDFVHMIYCCNLLPDDAGNKIYILTASLYGKPFLHISPHQFRCRGMILAANLSNVSKVSVVKLIERFCVSFLILPPPIYGSSCKGSDRNPTHYEITPLQALPTSCFPAVWNPPIPALTTKLSLVSRPVCTGTPGRGAAFFLKSGKTVSYGSMPSSSASASSDALSRSSLAKYSTASASSGFSTSSTLCFS